MAINNRTVAEVQADTTDEDVLESQFMTGLDDIITQVNRSASSVSLVGDVTGTLVVDVDPMGVSTNVATYAEDDSIVGATRVTIEDGSVEPTMMEQGTGAPAVDVPAVGDGVEQFHRIDDDTFRRGALVKYMNVADPATFIPQPGDFDFDGQIIVTY